MKREAKNLTQGCRNKMLAKKAYEQEKVKDSDENRFQNIVSSDGEAAPDQYHEGDIGRFCSIIGVRPKTLSEVPYEQYSHKSHGGTPGDRKIFISVDAYENAKFWDYQNKRFKNNSITQTDVFFYNGVISGESIKDICRDAYGVPIGNGGGGANDRNSTSLEISKYCQMETAVLKAS